MQANMMGPSDTARPNMIVVCRSVEGHTDARTDSCLDHYVSECNRWRRSKNLPCWMRESDVIMILLWKTVWEEWSGKTRFAFVGFFPSSEKCDPGEWKTAACFFSIFVLCVSHFKAFDCLETTSKDIRCCGIYHIQERIIQETSPPQVLMLPCSSFAGHENPATPSRKTHRSNRVN